MTSRDAAGAYRAALDELAIAEREALRIPTSDRVDRVLELVRRAHELYEAIPAFQRPVGIGRPPRPLALVRTQPVLRRARHSDWHPMSWRGQDN